MRRYLWWRPPRMERETMRPMCSTGLESGASLAGRGDTHSRSSFISRPYSELSGCEERDGGPDMPYIYDRSDFVAWLAAFDASD